MATRGLKYATRANKRHVDLQLWLRLPHGKARLLLSSQNVGTFYIVDLGV